MPEVRFGKEGERSVKGLDFILKAMEATERLLSKGTTKADIS